MSTSIAVATSTAISAVYKVEFESVQNCTMFAQQVNYVDFENCDVNFDTISQTGVLTVQSSCLQVAGGDTLDGTLETNLTAVAVELANSIWSSFYESVEQASTECPADTDIPWYLGGGSKESDCSYTYVYNLSVNLVQAVHTALRQNCFTTAMQTNGFTCSSNVSFGSVNQEAFMQASQSCAMSDQDVQSAITAIQDWVLANQASLKAGQEEFIIAICVVGIVVVSALILAFFVEGPLMAVPAITAGLALGIAIWLFVGYYISVDFDPATGQWWPYQDPLVSPDNQGDNQKLFVLGVLLVASLLLVSVGFSSYGLHEKLSKPKSA